MYSPRKPPTSNPTAVFQSALTAHQAGRMQEAESLYREIAQQGGKPGAVPIPILAIVHYNLGLLLQEGRRLPEAEAAYRQSLALRPESVEAHYNLGNLLQAMGRLAEAEAAYRNVLALRPDYIDAHNNLGNVFRETRRLEEAELAYRRVLELRPGSAEAHNNLGNVFKAAKRLDEAEASYRHALALRPDFADAHHNLGFLFEETRRLAEAEAAYHRALALQPNLADAHHSLGNLLKETGRLEEAEKSYRRALEIRPDCPDTRCSLSLLLLALGRYPEAWPYHESRYDPRVKTPATVVPRLPFPQWRGESLAGKSMLLLPEQGFGDYIQFARYAGLLKQHGLARLTLGCAPTLKPLLETVDGVDAVVTDLADLASMMPHDYWSLPLSLPLYCGTTLDNLPAALPYLHALPARTEYWRPRLPHGGLKVGLVWKGNADHKNDCNRSLPGLTSLAPLWQTCQTSGVTFISLQKGAGEKQAATAPDGQPILALGPEIADFADTAAIVAQLDLVICADTAIAHLAGALNKPCWVLLPASRADWRWLYQRRDSPWYPGVMHLFRQTTPGDWSDTIDEVAAALQVWAGAAVKVDCPALR
jgi:tetratricopeptide (TPR) repeat protein